MSGNEKGSAREVNGRDESGLTPAQRTWLSHIGQCEAEGLSYKAYCQREGLKVGGLYAARKVLRAANVSAAPSPARFAAVRLAQPDGTGLAQVSLPNGVQVSVTVDTIEALVELVRGLDQLRR